MINSTTKKISLLLVFLTFLNIETFGQRFYSVVFNQLPKDMQLYARDDSSVAEVPVSGVIEIPGWDHISVVTYRNKKRVDYNRSVLAYGGKTAANFELKPKIKSEMADYGFEVYACRQTDSVLVVTRKDIVAGDFYIINGQSNAAANVSGDTSSKYCRTIARIPDASPAIGAGDTLWIPSAYSWTYVGAWGIELQNTILRKYGIPTCVINGSLPGTKIDRFVTRDEANPAKPTSLYGLLLHRVNIARPTRIRGFFWYQGEQDALENVENYEQQFDKLFKYWQQDYPMIDQFIVLQINILFNPFEVAGEIRDFQRRTKYLYPKTEHFATVGIPGYDGVHYSIQGYHQIGQRLFNFLEAKNYGSAPVKEVSCPDIKKVFYSSSEKDEITLVFDEGQQLKWPADTVITGENGSPVAMSARNLFFLNGDHTKPAVVKSGKATGNRVRLSMSGPVNSKTISYLPLSKPVNVPVFRGPYIANSRGLGAFSFSNVGLAEALIIPSLSTESATGTSVDIRWQAAAGASGYVLERKSEEKPDFVKIKEFDDKVLIYNDHDVILDKKYTYRLMAFSNGSESPAVESSVTVTLILATEPQSGSDLINVYPNPVTDKISIDFKQAASGVVTIVSKNGQRILSEHIFQKKEYIINAAFLPAGTYIITFKDARGAAISRKLVK